MTYAIRRFKSSVYAPLIYISRRRFIPFRSHEPPAFYFKSFNLYQKGKSSPPLSGAAPKAGAAGAAGAPNPLAGG